jgi:hypothetical protein
MKEKILEVLNKLADKQINLKSESAREMIAQQILNALNK